MDSPNSQQHSHQPSPDPGAASASGSGSGFNGSGTGSGSGSGFSFSGSGGSLGDTSPSAGNNTQEGDNSSSSMKSKSSADQPQDEEEEEEEEEEEDMDVDITDSLAPTKPEPESSTGKGKMVDTATCSSCREGKAKEIGLLTDLYTLLNETGRYLLSGRNGQREFYRFWIEEEGDYATKHELDEKINELHARFLKNMDKDVEGPTDPIDVEILRLSHWIWGNEIDSSKEIHNDDYDGDNDDDDDGGGGDQEQDSKDLSDANMVDAGVNPNDQSSGHETADARHGDDDKDSKDSTKESGLIGKDSSSKAN
ncbi:hypothetical protein R6Q59_032291 [Mikania micrantha]|uniref:Uncharacterized protein n=1 Tax=Mikania micrantha TaxID=192012 RepID=A0A5N6NR30_9ASTR|nr:hypothetical protein E3N88_16970 [Mikania micrantha]